MKRKITYLSSFLGFCLFVSACASSPTVSLGKMHQRQRSIHVKNFELRASNAPTNLASNFTERLRKQLQKETKILLTSQKAELYFSGEITKYDITPIAPRGGQEGDFALLATLQRLTITVNVQYKDNLDNSQNFDQEFSFFADFANTQILEEVKQALISSIFDQLILDIFNKSVANW